MLFAPRVADGAAVTARDAKPACYEKVAFFLLIASRKGPIFIRIDFVCGRRGFTAGRRRIRGCPRQPAALGAIRELDWEDHREVADKSGMYLVMKKPCGVKRFRC